MSLQIYCDGSAHERPARPGGWAFVIVENDLIRLSQTGGLKSTNSNTMELLAATSALQAVLDRAWHVDQPIELISDSRLVIDIALGATAPKVHTLEGLELQRLCVAVRAMPKWVKAHNGNRWNEHVDVLAHEAKQQLTPERFRKRQR